MCLHHHSLLLGWFDVPVEDILAVNVLETYCHLVRPTNHMIRFIVIDMLIASFDLPVQYWSKQRKSCDKIALSHDHVMQYSSGV